MMTMMVWMRMRMRMRSLCRLKGVMPLSQLMIAMVCSTHCILAASRQRRHHEIIADRH